MDAFIWVVAVGGALIGAVVAGAAWWRMRARAERFERLLADTEESRYALEVQAETMVARLEAMTQVLVSQQRAIDAAMNRAPPTPSTMDALGMDAPDTSSPTTVPAVLQRTPGRH